MVDEPLAPPGLRERLPSVRALHDLRNRVVQEPRTERIERDWAATHFESPRRVFEQVLGVPAPRRPTSSQLEAPDAPAVDMATTMSGPEWSAIGTLASELDDIQCELAVAEQHHGLAVRPDAPEAERLRAVAERAGLSGAATSKIVAALEHVTARYSALLVTDELEHDFQVLYDICDLEGDLDDDINYLAAGGRRYVRMPSKKWTQVLLDGLEPP